MNLTLKEISLLQLQAGKKKLPTNEYLTDTNNENFKYIKSKFFFGEKNEKVQLLNTGSGLFSSICTTISSFVGSPVIDLDFPTKLLVTDYLNLWYATFSFERDIEWEISIKYLPAEQYIRKDGKDCIVRLYYDYDDSWVVVKTYYLITSYSGGIIENNLYEAQLYSYTSLKEVPLDTIWITSNLQKIINTWVEKCFFLVKDDEQEQFPFSLVDTVKNIVYSIDRKIVMFDCQFIQNTESFVMMKWIRIPRKLLTDYDDWKKIDFSSIGRYITWEADSSIEFVNNKNELITQAIEYEKEQIKKISSITSVPLDFLWQNESGSIWKESRTIIHGAFIRKIEQIRELFDKYIIEMLKQFESEGIKTEYTWNDIFVKDASDILDELKKARDLQLISQFTAIKKYTNQSDEEIQNELSIISQEWSSQENLTNLSPKQNNHIIE